MNKFSIISSVLILAASHNVFAADSGGIAVGATRVIYDAKSREASLSVINHSGSQYFLVQSWVDDQSGSKKVPFKITPPLFRLNADKENMLRIIKTDGALPADRESVYWVNVKAIPPAPEDSEGQNVLQLAIKTRVKLFYRPAGLPGTPDESPGKLVWSQQGTDVVAKNPTAYSVSLNNLSVNGSAIKDLPVSLPQSETHYKIPAGIGHASKVSFTSINDFGGLSKTVDSIVH